MSSRRQIGGRDFGREGYGRHPILKGEGKRRGRGKAMRDREESNQALDRNNTKQGFGENEQRRQKEEKEIASQSKNLNGRMMAKEENG